MTQQIIQSAMALNARSIHQKEVDIKNLIVEAKAWKEQGEASFSADAYKDAAKERSKLRKLVGKQQRMKVELQAVYRNERIRVKFVKVFGPHNNQLRQTYTSVEQEAMLDSLLAEKAAKVASEAVTNTVYE